MRDGNVFGCAAFIILLLTLRLCFPVQAGQVYAWANQAVDPENFCRALACTLGQELDSAGLKDGLIAVFRMSEEALE